MKKLYFTLLFISSFLLANSQTFVDSVNSTIHSAALSATEPIYYRYDNSSLVLHNTDMSLKQTLTIPSKANCVLYNVSYPSKTLFDADNGIEFIVIYRDTLISTYTIEVVDNGTGTALPALSNLDVSNVIIRNVGSASQLIVYEYVINSGLINTKSYLFDLPGQVIGLKKYDLEPIDAIYPNPTADILKVNGRVNEPYEILDINGSLVKSGRLVGLDSEVVVTTLPKGSYFVRMATGATYKFVKQ